MFSSMTNWLGMSQEREAESDEENKENKGKNENNEKNPDSESEKEKLTSDPDKKEPENKEEGDGDIDISLDAAKHKLEDVSSKALNAAKEWGSYLYSFSKEAGKTVADKAKLIGKSVEDKTIMGDFAKEQNKFVTEKKEKAKRSEAAVPPWVGYNEEETMKSQIMALSTDKRNFVRNPPAGVQFQFEFEASYPVAMATLQEDSNLQKMRFDLVPKQVKEDIFWRNYFYRVSLIKQSTQLTSLAQETGSMGSRSNSTGSFKSSDENQEKESTPPQAIQQKSKVEDDIPCSPAENEFVSDTFQADALNDEDLKKEMQQLHVEDDKKGDDNEWENELQAELKEYEMVGQEGEILDDELENEILQEIENETNNM
ncbi:synapse-associated protein 1-like isoform X3 [Mytilus edulis]|uniref:synapse-associated protein 1-like isoform X1 n=1 Tax=Mytilus edulis TaxID=6550 RepID=UPI0039F03613